MNSPFQLRLIECLADVDPHAWNAIAGSQVCVSHALLATLEDTGCVGGQSGWNPCHLGLWRENRLVAALPLYEKYHSYGEYVFDWAWADAYARSGLAYYPKLLSAIPFTPIPGMRLLGSDEQARRALIGIAVELARESEVSSLHVLFPTDIEAQWMREAGFLIRLGVQFHWVNRGYRDFDTFLGSLNHDKRKKIRQERRRAAQHGLNLRWLDGHEATLADWSFFHGCYANTYALHRSTPYLTPEFFTTLAGRAPDCVRLLVACRGNERIASAFFLCDGKALYGRYWGATESLPFLHFELCYYQAIEYCIAHGLERFEGGAQGEHKLARGLEPTVTRSAHWIRDPRFRDAVDRHLMRESAGMDFYLDELSERSPFRQTPASSS